MHRQRRTFLAIFALLVCLLIEALEYPHSRIQTVLVLHPQIVLIIITQMILASIALYIHYTHQYDKRRIGSSLAFISVLLTFYIGWLCFH